LIRGVLLISIFFIYREGSKKQSVNMKITIGTDNNSGVQLVEFMEAAEAAEFFNAHLRSPC